MQYIDARLAGYLFYYFTHSAFSELVFIEKWSEQVVKKLSCKKKSELFNEN